MTTNPPLPDRLARLGESLDRAVRADLAAHAMPRRRLRHPRRVAAVAFAALALPALAYAAHELITPSQVAASLPQGTKALIGTDPTCTVVRAGIEYHCVLASAPTGDTADSPSTTGTETGQSSAEAWIKLRNGEALLVKASSEPALRQKILRLEQRYGVGSSVLPNGAAGNSTTTTTANDWTGTVEPTVDATKHVNGGCRAEDVAGTEWECYLGEAAVGQKIISQGFLGQYAPNPGVG